MNTWPARLQKPILLQQFSFWSFNHEEHEEHEVFGVFPSCFHALHG
jgi:hypothetical protein